VLSSFDLPQDEVIPLLKVEAKCLTHLQYICVTAVGTLHDRLRLR